MSFNQTPEVLKAARLLGPALGRKASDPGTLRLAAAVLSATDPMEPAISSRRYDRIAATDGGLDDPDAVERGTIAAMANQAAGRDPWPQAESIAEL